ncbi:hypothetical protein Syn6312_3356 [Synechococcus sp. PCC 6312]|nr:hypothetical protein Syn6312_0897 [Synechococcus sp. PCC 6312]AFY62388.1 hypothetical protein Syn6312_3356 [Synechococcus sp. PCC 6312]
MENLHLVGSMVYGKLGVAYRVVDVSKGSITVENHNGILFDVNPSAICRWETSEEVAMSQMPGSKRLFRPRASYTEGQRVEVWITSKRRWLPDYYYCKPHETPLLHWVRTEDAPAETSVVEDTCLRPYGSMLFPPMRKQVKLT